MFSFYFKRTLLKLFLVFPVKPRKIFFSSYEGQLIACNPKYIYDEMKKRFGNNRVYIWDYNKVTEKQINEENIIFVKHNSVKYIYHVMTSKILITNTGISPCFPLRKTQLSINTWHGAGCYKKVGKDLSSTDIKSYKKYCCYMEKNITYYLSGCGAWTKVFSEAVFSSPEKFLAVGSPRIDILLNRVSDEYKKKIKEKLTLKNRLVLYAPTYRGDRDTPEKASCPIDVERLLAAMKQKFGGDWIFGYRCHYATASHFKNINNSIDLSWYEEMQDILMVSDSLISDYSSVIWDYSFTGKPCFLYCYDLEQYTDERDFYLPIKRWHFPISKNMDELIRDIESFDAVLFEKGMQQHHEELDSYEHGDATEKVVNIISNYR